METARAAHLLQLLADAVNAFADDAAVGLDLGLARATEKAEAAALAFEMRPRPDQPALLVDEVSELDLQAPFPRPRSPAEDLEDESGAIQHLRSPCRFEIALLHGRQWMIDDDEPDLFGAHEPSELLDFAGAEQRRGTRRFKRHQSACGDVEIDRSGKPDRLVETRLRRSLESTAACRTVCLAPPATDRQEHERPHRALARASSGCAAASPFLPLQRLRVGRTQLLSGTFRVGDFCKLNGRARHDCRDRVLVNELRMPVPSQQHAEIVEPGHDALKLDAVDEKYRERGLCLANMIEKSVLKALRAFCCHGASSSLLVTLTLFFAPGAIRPRPLWRIRRDYEAIPQGPDPKTSSRSLPARLAGARRLAQGRASLGRVHPESAQFAVQRRPLHADELGRARDIAAESVDLSQKIFTLEDLAGVAQRERHQMLAPCPIRRERNRRNDLVGKHVGGDDAIGIAADKDHQPLDVIAQLPHVAGPVVRLQHGHGVVADAARWQPGSDGNGLHEIAHELRQVLAPLG